MTNDKLEDATESEVGKGLGPATRPPSSHSAEGRSLHPDFRKCLFSCAIGFSDGTRSASSLVTPNRVLAPFTLAASSLTTKTTSSGGCPNLSTLGG